MNKTWTRRQASLFLPASGRKVIDEVREVSDPAQHALIPAHVTLCRGPEVPCWETLAERLRSAPMASITLTFDLPVRLDDGCVLLPCSGGRGQYRALRHHLLEKGAYDSEPHITLVHPRHYRPGDAFPDVSVLEGIDLSITFRTVQLIEQVNSQPWQVLESVPLGGTDLSRW